MKGDFCRMCGSNKLCRKKSTVHLESQKKSIKDVWVWVCENCGEEFLDDTSREKLYQNSKKLSGQRTLVHLGISL